MIIKSRTLEVNLITKSQEHGEVQSKVSGIVFLFIFLAHSTQTYTRHLSTVNRENFLIGKNLETSLTINMENYNFTGNKYFNVI